MLKNKSILIIIVVILFLLLAGAGYFLFYRNSAQKMVNTTSVTQVSGPQTLSPDAIGLTLTASANNKQVKFSIAKLGDINAISYQLVYEANSTPQEISEGGDPRVQRGIIGDAKINPGASSYDSPLIDLGSASKSVVRYDTGIKSVDLVLKITKTDGKVYQSEKKLNL